MMFTTDMALRMDPEFSKIAKRFYENPDEFEKAFAKAWFKLTHRDMGPAWRLLGPEVPEPQLWQDPVPVADYEVIDQDAIQQLKKAILDSGLAPRELVYTAWSSAATFRDSDKRGGANGARIRLAPQKDWEVNEPEQLTKVLSKLERIQHDFNESQTGKQRVSLADLIVLGGCTAIEEAARKGGHKIVVPFRPGRTDTTQALTDVRSFGVLEPTADAFRNYLKKGDTQRPDVLLVDRANQLNLTIPEMAVLIGGLRVLNANYAHSADGVLTDHPGTLSNDFFVNLTDMSIEWTKTDDGRYVGRDRKTGKVKWSATMCDLVFGAHSELRAVSEVYASDDAKQKFLDDFAAAWHKVMNLDRPAR